MLKLIMPILLLAGAIFLGKYLIATGPEAKKKVSKARVPVVEVMQLKHEDYTVYVKASGVVKAGIQSNLVSEAAGRVIRISDDFQEGGYFSKNQTLIEIDKENYLNAISIAESDVAASKANLVQINEEEKSNLRSFQLAKSNLALGKKEVVRLRGLWRKKLIARSLLDGEEQKMNQLEQKLQDIQGKQNTYVSRRSAIQAQINSSKARLKQEQLNLSRTLIKTPYAGRVLKKNVDVGQFVSKGSELGEVYATDYVNVELPLSLSQYELLGMPESFRNKQVNKSEYPEVTFTHSDRLRNDSWKGRVVRSSAALDSESRQINVIVRIDNPFDLQEGSSSPVRIGQYLNARIKGKTFKNVFVLPPIAVRHNREILLLNKDEIDVVPIKVIWNASDATIIKSNKKLPSDRVVMTGLSQAVQGTKVITLEEQRKKNLKIKQAKSNKDKNNSFPKDGAGQVKGNKKVVRAVNDSESKDSKTK